MTSSISHFRLAEHARFEMNRRQITLEQVARALSEPEQVANVGAGLRFFQRRIMLGDPPKQYVLRVLVDVDQELPNVVTVYRSSKVKKYTR